MRFSKKGKKGQKLGVYMTKYDSLVHISAQKKLTGLNWTKISVNFNKGVPLCEKRSTVPNQDFRKKNLVFFQLFGVQNVEK